MPYKNGPGSKGGKKGGREGGRKEGEKVGRKGRRKGNGGYKALELAVGMRERQSGERGRRWRQKHNERRTRNEGWTRKSKIRDLERAGRERRYRAERIGPRSCSSEGTESGGEYVWRVEGGWSTMITGREGEGERRKERERREGRGK